MTEVNRMIRYGFIRTKDEIKFLILTCMTYLPFPVSYESIVDVCTWCDDGFGYFELSEAFAELQESAHIEECQPTQYRITDKGRETAEVFRSRLPFTVREAAEVSALRVIRKIRRDAQVTSEVQKIGEHEFTVTMNMEGVFSLTMNVVSQSQAALLQDTFHKNAEAIYGEILGAVTKDYDDT